MIFEVGAEDIENIKALFVEYEKELGVDLCFQNFNQELDNLPGKYNLPKGNLFIAKKNGKAIGCVAVRPIDNSACELKRMYLKPEARGEKIGEKLLVVALDFAKNAGYEIIKLDTLDHLQAAISLYKKHGFTETQPYIFNPIDSVKYYSKNL